MAKETLRQVAAASPQARAGATRRMENAKERSYQQGPKGGNHRILPGGRKRYNTSE